MRISFLNPQGQLGPLKGFLSIRGNQTALCCHSRTDPSKLMLHHTEQPDFTEENNRVFVDQGHVYIKGRNFLILAKDRANNTRDHLISFKVPLPAKASGRVVEVFNAKGDLLGDRIYGDHSELQTYLNGRTKLLTVWGFTLLRPGEQAKIHCLRRVTHKFRKENIGHWLLSNNQGDTSVTWHTTTS
jgi:hypothetical protein